MTKQIVKISDKVRRNYLIKKKPFHTNSTKGTSICIINNSQVVQEGVSSLISNLDNINKIITTSQKDFFDIYAMQEFDIIITEIEFENRVDTSFVKQLKSLLPEAEIIVYTRLDNNRERNLALHYGAQFFLLWGDTYNLLERIIKTMIRKTIYSK